MTDVRHAVTVVRPHVTNASPLVTIVRRRSAGVTIMRPHVTNVRHSVGRWEEM
ncbi:MAG TPA: hypothetical protein VFC82_00410 [Actinomycetaceae bacterium]|nr:hypothetical protein [Actinomycetaceae bacterium]